MEPARAWYRMSFESAALIATWAAILLLAFMISGLVRQIHALSKSPEPRVVNLGPAVGQVLPLDEDVKSVFSPPGVLLFVSSTCPSCRGVLEEVRSLMAKGGLSSVVAIFSNGPGADSHDGIPALWAKQAFFQACSIVATPTAVWVSDTWQVLLSAPVGSPEMFRDFVREGGTDGIRADSSAARL